MAASIIQSRWLLVSAAILLAITRIALAVFPFRVVLAAHARLSAAASLRQRKRARSSMDAVCRAVLRASRHVPGTQHCLTMALAAKLLLARGGTPTELRVGVAKSSAGDLTAHAWLEANGKAVFGATESELETFRVLPRLQDRLEP